MTTTTIIGIDFSGAWSDNNIWVAQGGLDDADGLRFHDAEICRRTDIYNLLARTQPPAVVAMDFPFGVPAQFAVQLVDAPPPTAMSEVWKTIYNTHAEDFVAARHRFVDAHGEPKRAGDQKYYRESYSPLHMVNPVMLGMTYAGVYMLHRLHQEQPNRWHVPPMAKPSGTGATVTLLETMPGALLKAVDLRYKGYKGGPSNWQPREAILNGLAVKFGVPLHNLQQVRNKCLAHHDCLDSVVAAVGAAMWAQDCRRFRHPSADQKFEAAQLQKLRWPAEYSQRTELEAARLEGWIYAPLPNSKSR